MRDPNLTSPTGDYLQPGEAQSFSAEGTSKFTDQQIQIEQDKSWRQTGKRITADEALTRLTQNQSGLHVNPVSGETYQYAGNTVDVAPMTVRDVNKYIAAKYPYVASAAINSGLSALEQAKHANFVQATDLAQRMMQTGNPYRVQQLFATAGPDLQPMVESILKLWMQDAQKADQNLQDNASGSTLTDAVSWAWGHTVGPSLDTLWQANQEAVHAVNAIAAMTTGMSPADAYAATVPGTLDPGMVDVARKKYGDTTVNVILATQKAKQSDNPDRAIGELYKQFSDANDIASLNTLDALIYGVQNDQNVQDAATYLGAADQGNIGNTAFWSMAAMFGVRADSVGGTIVAQSPIYTAGSTGWNLTAQVGLDPTLVLGRTVEAYKSARYGLRLLAPDRYERAMAQGPVRRFFDEFGKALDGVRAEADQTIAAQRLNSVRAQYKRWFTDDAIDTMMKAGVTDAASATDFFEGGANLRLMTKGQTAKRGSNFVIPHMMKATAIAKRASALARGLTYDKHGGAMIDAIFGEGVSRMIPEEAVPKIVARLSAEGGDKFVGRMLSDFVFTDAGAKRTFIGKILGDSWLASDGGKLETVMARYGWKRAGDPRARVERVTRLMAHMPDTRDGLIVADGSDAAKVRDLAMWAGMPKFWADYSAMLWKNMDQGQRVRFASGLGRSVGYATGIDLVDPIRGQSLIDNMVMGMRDGEIYAPDQRDLTSLRGKANTYAAQNMGDPAEGDLWEPFVNKAGNVSLRMTAEGKAEKQRLIREYMDANKDSAPLTNPSRVDGTDGTATNALYHSQMTDRIAMPDLNVMDRLGMRSSLLTALLGTNPTMTKIVDLWTFGTLAGPRFAARNGLEDAVLYGVTNGNWRDYRYGQLLSRARREATQRGRKTAEEAARGSKLGLGPSLTRWLGDHVPTSMQGIILPHLSSDEIAAANRMAALGDRDGLNLLIRKGLLRQKTIFFKKPNADAQWVSDLDDLAASPMGYHMMDEASETARHLIDGIAPGQDAVREVTVAGETFRIASLDAKYVTSKVRMSDPADLRAWWDNLTMVLHGDRGKGVKAVALSRRYYQAKLSGDLAKQQEIVDEFAAWIGEHAPWVMEKSGIAASQGVTEFARRNLDDVLRLFTTSRGGYNYDLLSKIKRVEVDEVTGEKSVTYALWDKVDGEPVYRLSEGDLAQMPGKPQSVLERQGIDVAVSDKPPLTQRGFEAMGRSLARLTREPIFTANYLDSRRALRPIEKVWAEHFGEEAAKSMATEAAYERAYSLTMAYTDNPMTRSQLAWQVRNVSRFYRATEDFMRRMLRLAKNDPLAIQRMNLGWRIMDDTGFTWTDEYGQKYFIWPGSRYVMEAVNKVTQQFGVDLHDSPLPMVFTSNVTMLSPSADPNAVLPTFNGPYASFALKPLMRLTPGLQQFEDEAFGTYSKSQTVWESIFPSNVQRGMVLFGNLISSQDARWHEDTTTFASSARSAIQAYAAAGLFDESKQYSPAERDAMRQQIDLMALDIQALKFVLSPVMIASFSVEPLTVTDYARSIGVTGMRQAFVQLLTANKGDTSAAYLDWVKNNPGKSIFTVSSNTNGQDIGNYQPFKETVQWITDNGDTVKDYPIGASFFAPQTGTQNLAAWNYLRAMGAKVPKSVDRYFNEMSTATGYVSYRVLQDQYFAAKAAGDESADTKWANAKNWLYAQYPGLSSRLSGQDRVTANMSASDNQRVMEDVRGAAGALQSQGSFAPESREWYVGQVVSLYDQARSQLGVLSKDAPDYDKQRKAVREKWMNAYGSLLPLFPNDQAWESLMYTSTAALGFEVPR